MKDEEFDYGVKSHLKENGIVFSSASSEKFCTETKEIIQNTLKALNSCVKGSKKRIGNLQGDMAEYVFPNIFNMKAQISGSPYRADVLRSTELGSVDIVIYKIDTKGNAIPDSAIPYSLKYYKSGKQAAAQQARTFGGEYQRALATKIKKDPQITCDTYTFDDFLKERNLDKKGISENTLLYGDQIRLIPKGKMTAAKTYLKNLIKKETNPARRENLQKVLDLLADRLESPDGKVGFITLTRTQSEQIAKTAKKEGLDLDKLGFSVDDLLTNKIIWNKSLEIGKLSACITFAIEIAPQLIDVIHQLFAKGYIDMDSFDMFNAVEDATSSFVLGTLTSYITFEAYKRELLTEINPEIISLSVMMCFMSITTTIKGYKDNLPKNVIASQLIENSNVLIWGYVANNLIGSKIANGLGMLIGKSLGTIGDCIIPVIGTLVGTLVGSYIGSLINEWFKEKGISLCIEKGYTFFGLVEQDYTIPEPLLKLINSDPIELKSEIITSEVAGDPISLEGISESPIGFGEKILKLMLERQVVEKNKIAYIVR